MSVLVQVGNEVKSLLVEGSIRRKVAEITIGNTGERLLYRCKDSNPIKEVNEIVKALEKEHGSRIIWKFRNETTIYVGSIPEESMFQKTKRAILEFLEWD